MIAVFDVTIVVIIIIIFSEVKNVSKPYTFCHFTTLYGVRIFLTIFSFLFWGEFLEASYSGYMPLLVSLTSHSTQDASGLGGRSRNSSRMLSNEGNKMTAGGCFGRPV